MNAAADPLAQHMPVVAVELFGAPNPRHSKPGKPRWGTNGSLSIDEGQGIWFDHENQRGGGVLDLIAREKQLKGGEAIAWLDSIGCHVNGAKAAPRSTTSAKKAQERIIESYDYLDMDGSVALQVRRIGFVDQDSQALRLNGSGKPEKTFRQCRPDPDEPACLIWGIRAGEYMRKGPGENWRPFDAAGFPRLPTKRQRKTFPAAKVIPYRAPELVEAIANGQTVFVVEGEQKADALARWNLAGTCNAQGSGKWTAEHAAYLRGADVVILPDNDEAGRKHADEIAASLAGIAARVRTLALPGLGAKQDIVDWQKADHTREELDALLEDAADWTKPAAPPAQDYAPPPAAPGPKLFTKAEFTNGFVPPDYLIDDILQRRYVYGLTASTGHGKTAVALLISRLVSDHRTPHPIFGRHAVDHGAVVYFAGENPEDLRARVIADDSCAGRDGSADRIVFIPGTHSIDDMAAVCRAEVGKLDGKMDLIVVDTSAAYFLGDNENDNPQMGSHARTLRRLTELPGGPTVLVLCHPAKHVTEATQLQPRGGGAFIAELDGNLTLWKTDDLAELSHNKMRGPGFEPLSFRLERITCAELIDSKGRSISSVRAVAVTDADQEIIGKANRADEDMLLVAMLEPGQSIAQLAIKCGWVTDKGTPYKSKAQRRLNALAKAGLAKPVRGEWELTDKGRGAADSATRPAPTDARTEAGK